MVPNANDNATDYLEELDETRIGTPVAGKRIKAFTKWHKTEPGPTLDTKDDLLDEEDVKRLDCTMIGYEEEHINKGVVWLKDV